MYVQIKGANRTCLIKQLEFNSVAYTTYIQLNEITLIVQHRFERNFDIVKLFINRFE